MNKIQKEILIGKLLGDAHISKISDTKARFQIAQSDKQSEYVEHLYEIFKDLCGTAPKYNVGKYTTVYFNSLSSEELLDVYRMFINDNVKGVPQNIKEILTARGLAYWFMDDGTSYYAKGRQSKNIKSSVLFCTDCFTKDDVELLIDTLKENFNIQSSLSKPPTRKGYRIYIGTREAQKFYDIIEPFIIDSMRYKIKRPYIL